MNVGKTCSQCLSHGRVGVGACCLVYVSSGAMVSITLVCFVRGYSNCWLWYVVGGACLMFLYVLNCFGAAGSSALIGNLFLPMSSYLCCGQYKHWNKTQSQFALVGIGCIVVGLS